MHACQKPFGSYDQKNIPQPQSQHTALVSPPQTMRLFVDYYKLKSLYNNSAIVANKAMTFEIRHYHRLLGLHQGASSQLEASQHHCSVLGEKNRSHRMLTIDRPQHQVFTIVSSKNCSVVGLWLARLSVVTQLSASMEITDHVQAWFLIIVFTHGLGMDLSSTIKQPV